MTEQVQEINKTRRLGKQLTTAGGVLIALSILFAIFQLLGDTTTNWMLVVGLVLGVPGMVMSRVGKK